MNKKIVALWIILLFFAISPVSATTITFTDVTCLNTELTVCTTTLYLYYPNGTLAGVLNGTAGNVNIDTSVGLNIYLKPSSISLFNNPEILLDWVLNSFQAIIVIVFIFAFPIATFYIIRRLFIGKDPIQASQGAGWGKWRRK